MRGLLSVRGVTTAAACIVCLSATLCAQDPANEDPLGDVARQTRVPHAAAPADKSSKAQGLVDEMQQEQEAAESAPTGFRNYNAGEYRLYVPFPYSLEGRENGGAVLAGSRLGVTNTEVMTGTPVPIPTSLSDADLLNAVRQIASMHGQQAYCNATKQGTRKAYRCSWQNSPVLLGRQVWGTMEVIVGSNSLIPVMCVSPDDVHQPCVVYDTWGHNTCSDRDRQLYGWDQRKAQAAHDASYREERSTLQICEQIIYPSIQLKEDIVVHPASIAESKLTKPAVMTSAAAPQDNGGTGAKGPSLAELARRTREEPRERAQAKLDNAEGTSVAPVGFQSFVITFCQNPPQCSEASVVIPEKAEVISRTNGQHIFKAALGGNAVMLYAGPADVSTQYRSMTDRDYIRMRDLANSNGWSQEKPDGVSTQELTIEGRPALMTRFRFQREPKRWWIGERVLIQHPVAQFLVGCAAPEEHFADAEVWCTTLVNSLRLP